MKKRNPGRALIFSLAVLMLLALQSVSAQTSATAEATAGIFRTDVDNFMSPGDYAGIDMQKWFGTLRVENVVIPGAIPDLQAGLALKISDLYFGFYYKGQYSSGSVTEQTLTGGVPPALTAVPAWGGSNWTLTGGTPASADGVTNNNDIALLIGFKDMGIKLGFVDTTNRLEVPKVRLDSATASSIGLDDTTTYYLRGLQGDMTPSVAWGTTVPIDVGSLSIKPTAELQLKISYNQIEFLDEDSKQVYIDVANNSFTPLLKLDSGAATLFEGGWGAFAVGIADSFSYVFPSEGPTGTPEEVEWKNTFTPYAEFKQTVTQALSFGAKLSIPLAFHYDGTAGTYTFSLDDPNDYDTVAARNKPGYLKAGVQYSFVEGKLANKLTLNAGFAIDLPIYKYDFSYTNEAKAHTWGPNTTLQKVTLGAQFHFGPNAMLDVSTNFMDGGTTGGSNNKILENQIWDSLLNYTSIGLTIKY